MKEDWLEYFELINKRQPTFEEFLAAKNNDYKTPDFTADNKVIEPVKSVRFESEKVEIKEPENVKNQLEKAFLAAKNTIEKRQFSIFDIISALGGVLLLIGIYMINFINLSFLSLSMQGSLSGINGQIESIESVSSKMKDFANLLVDMNINSKIPAKTSEIASQIELVKLAVNSLVLTLTILALIAILASFFKSSYIKILGFSAGLLTTLISLAIYFGAYYAAASLNLSKTLLMTSTVSFFLLVGAIAMGVGHGFTVFKKKNKVNS